VDRLGSDVRGALRAAGVPDAGVLAEVTRAWPAAVGPAIARSAWPLRIARDGTLLVATESSTWAHELALLEDELRTRLHAAVGDECPVRLRFAVGPVPSPSADPERDAPTPPAVAPADASLAADLASAIDDPELRSLVRRAAAASLAARRSDRGL
jgi:hypothetical protein